MYIYDTVQFLEIMQQERAAKNRNGLYHATQIELAYNSNRIEGMKITKKETTNLFETQVISTTPDLQALSNHFIAFNFILDTIDESLTQDYLKELHVLLMTDTEDSQENDFILGDWRTKPRFIASTIPTAAPSRIEEKMENLLYDGPVDTFEDIVRFHGKFEKIHPFFNGNGRIGRLIAFKQCVECNLMNT